MMSSEIVLLVLRIAIAVALYAFLGALLLLTLREIRATGQQIQESLRASARLVIIDADETGLEVGQIYSLQPHTSIGRGPTSTIVLPDSFASTDHAHIMLRQNQWWLEDQQSRNGTTLNNVPLEDAVVLSSGDIIGIGRIKLRFETG